MVNIVPTITASDPHHYREQIERVAAFAPRLHIDLSDGLFAPTKLLDLNQAWLPENKAVDLHLMLQKPLEVIEQAIGLKPTLIIVHCEAEVAGEALQIIRNASIKCGVALLPKTSVDSAIQLLEKADHVLIFGGHLGYQGGEADLDLLDKVRAVKQRFPALEVGWDGGVNDSNAAQLIDAGVDVLNVGGYIQHADQPADAYAKLLALAES